MLSALGIAASGMRDAMVRVDVAANNIANVSTGGFVPSQVLSTEVPEGGVASVVTAGAPGAAVLVDVPFASGTDLATEMANLIIAKAAFSANASAFRTAAEMHNTLLDLLG